MVGDVQLKRSLLCSDTDVSLTPYNTIQYYTVECKSYYIIFETNVGHANKAGRQIKTIYDGIFTNRLIPPLLMSL